MLAAYLFSIGDNRFPLRFLLIVSLLVLSELGHSLCHEDQWLLSCQPRRAHARLQFQECTFVLLVFERNQARSVNHESWHLVWGEPPWNGFECIFVVFWSVVGVNWRSPFRVQWSSLFAAELLVYTCLPLALYWHESLRCHKYDQNGPLYSCWHETCLCEGFT